MIPFEKIEFLRKNDIFKLGNNYRKIEKKLALEFFSYLQHQTKPIYENRNHLVSFLKIKQDIFFPKKKRFDLTRNHALVRKMLKYTKYAI